MCCVGTSATRSSCRRSFSEVTGKFRRECCCQRGNVRSHSTLDRLKWSYDRSHAHAQVPSHRNPSVERFRIHVKGMVGSPGWLDDFPEVGRRRGPWRGRWAKDLLDASATGENNSLRHGAARQRLRKKRNRAATQPSI